MAWSKLGFGHVVWPKLGFGQVVWPKLGFGQVVWLVCVLGFVSLSSGNVFTGCEDCVAHAECQGNQCVCSPGYAGDPHFYCRNVTADDCCCGNNDPVLMTVINENIVYHLIGSTLLTELKTSRRSPEQTNDHGECHFRLMGWTERYKGKFYFAGLGFEIEQRHGARIDTDKGYIFGEATSGKPYNYTILLEGNVDSGKEDDGCGVSFRHITRNFMQGVLPCCGIYFAIRVYHPDFPTREPGYYFRVPKVQAHSFMTDMFNVPPDKEGICLGGDHLTLENLLNSTGISDRRKAMTLVAMTNTNDTSYPNAPADLWKLKQSWKDCPMKKREDLFDIVIYFFNARMVKCMNGEGKSVTETITAMLAATQYICDNVSDKCYEMLFIINKEECLQVGNDIPEIGALQKRMC